MHRQPRRAPEPWRQSQPRPFRQGRERGTGQRWPKAPEGRREWGGVPASPPSARQLSGRRGAARDGRALARRLDRGSRYPRLARGAARRGCPRPRRQRQRRQVEPMRQP
eukprot:15445235-Alexandrium_andersonii.AAC.1